MPAYINDKEITTLERLQNLLDDGTLQQTSVMLNALQPAEIAHLLEALPLNQREIMWRLVDEDNRGDTLVHLADEVLNDLVTRMEHNELLEAAETLDDDDLADLMQDLPEAVASQVLTSLDSQHRLRLQTVLSYDEDTAGGLMNTDTVTVRPEVTLDVVLRYLRLLGDKLPESTDTLFVTNRQDKYLGSLSLQSLVSHDPSDTVAEVMSLDDKPLQTNCPAITVTSRFEQHDLLSAPVVDDNGILRGRITIDDVVDVIREAGEHQFMGQAGLSEDEDMFAPVMSSSKRRAIWLGINLITAFLASLVISQFEDVLKQYVALAVLMPIVASMGGIAGSQTLTLTIRGIALGQLTFNNARWLVLKELAVGSINSLIWAAVVGIAAGLWYDNINLAALIATAMSINLVIAALSGAILPLLLQRMKIDPALAGGVLLTTVTDIVGFLAFLGMASYFLN